jgi:G patch domain-containing protein 1
LESSVHDKDSFAKEQSKFSGSKSMNAPKPTQDSQQAVKTKTYEEINKVDNAPTTSVSIETVGFNKRMTVAEMFLKESEKDIKRKEDVNDTIQKFDRMELYNAIFLSESENEEEPKEEIDKEDDDYDDFIEKPRNVERNLSPPRGIFANIDFDELNSWRRNVDTERKDKDKINNEDKDKINKDDKDKINKDDKAKKNETTMEVEENEEADVYGPKIPENLKKRLEEGTGIDKDFKPVFRSKKDKELVHVIESSSSSDSWVDVKEVKSKKSKKKKKKHKSKHKKGKHKKKDK